MKTVIVQYKAGNTRSVYFALERVGIQAIVSSDADEIRSADKVVLPGVGAAANAMQYLREGGLDGVLKSLKQPVLGICLGMQLLCKTSEEGEADCLGIVDLPVKKFQGAEKIPQAGWNKIFNLKSGLFKGVDEGCYVYFTHSYYVPAAAAAIATTDYILDYTSALQKDNFYGVQFHPEKSGDVGHRILQNFLAL